MIRRIVHRKLIPTGRTCGAIFPRRGLSSGIVPSLNASGMLFRCTVPFTANEGAIASCTRRFSSTSSLVDALTQEIIEEDGDTELDQELLDSQQQILKNFTIEDADGVGIVTLTRTFEDEKIIVEFDCQAGENTDSLEGFDFDEDDEPDTNQGAKKGEVVDFDDGEDDDEEIYGNMGAVGSNFEVRVSRGDSTLLVDCFAGEQLEVNNVRFIGPQHKSIDAVQLYAGPKFESLAEPLQDAFYDYLAGRGIDDDLSFFVLTYSKDKEQREYVHWLKSVLEFSVKK